MEMAETKKLITRI